jgi:hypothetical protein
MVQKTYRCHYGNYKFLAENFHFWGERVLETYESYCLLLSYSLFLSVSE